MNKNSNLNRVFHALKRYHAGRNMSRRKLKALAVITVKGNPWFHRFAKGRDTAPWLG